MYMYYLLGYRLLGINDDSFYASQAENGRMARSPARNMAGGGGNIARRSKIFRSMNHIQRAQVSHSLSLSDATLTYIVVSWELKYCAVKQTYIGCYVNKQASVVQVAISTKVILVVTWYFHHHQQQNMVVQ